MKRSTLEWAPFFRGLSIISIIRKRQAEKEAENKMFVYVLYSHLLFQVKFAGEHHKPPFLFSGFSNHTDRMVFKKPFLGLDMNADTTSFAGTAMKVSWDCIRAPPRRGRYWEIHPRRPRDFLRPERFPEGEARGKS